MCWESSKDIVMFTSGNILCTDNNSEIYHVYEKQSRTTGNVMAPRTIHVASRSPPAGTVYFPVKRYFIRRGVHFLLFCSPSRNLFLERPVVMSVRNAALLYATRGCHCRVERAIFSGISQQKRARENSRSGHTGRERASYIIYAIIRIPTAKQRDGVQSFSFTVITLRLLSYVETGSQRTLWKIGWYIRDIVCSRVLAVPLFVTLHFRIR